MSEREIDANVNLRYLDQDRIAEDAFSELESAVLGGLELAKQAERYFLNNLNHLSELLRIFEEEHSDDPLIRHHIKKLRAYFGLSANSIQQKPDEQTAEA